MAHTPPEKWEETIFEIVNQLNRAGAFISSQDERDQLAEFNLIAGKRAKASTAYASALNYLIAGAAQLGDDCWERRRELAFSLEINRAECEFLTGELAAAEERLAGLSTRAASTVERASHRLSDPTDPGIFLWGDGAGAAVIEAGDREGFIGAALQADGTLRVWLGHCCRWDLRTGEHRCGQGWAHPDAPRSR